MRNPLIFATAFCVGIMSNTSVTMGILMTAPKYVIGSFPLTQPFIWGGWLLVHYPVLWILGAILSSFQYGWVGRKFYEKMEKGE